MCTGQKETPKGGASKMNDDLVIAVWEKGEVIPDYDATQWRRDAFGTAISFAAYGDRDSDSGWEIDHIVPVADGGDDLLSNLRPLHWKANVAR